MFLTSSSHIQHLVKSCHRSHHHQQQPHTASTSNRHINTANKDAFNTVLDMNCLFNIIFYLLLFFSNCYILYFLNFPSEKLVVIGIANTVLTAYLTLYAKLQSNKLSISLWTEFRNWKLEISALILNLIRIIEYFQRYDLASFVVRDGHKNLVHCTKKSFFMFYWIFCLLLFLNCLKMSSNKSGTIFCTINTFWVNLGIKVQQRTVGAKFWNKFSTFVSISNARKCFCFQHYWVEQTLAGS